MQAIRERYSHLRGLLEPEDGKAIAKATDGFLTQSISIRVHPEVNATVQCGVNGSVDWKYTRIPSEVLFDETLTRTDLRIYGVLAGATRQGNTASVGVRLIAKYVNRSIGLVSESIGKLIAAGYIQRPPVLNGRRSYYALASPVFGSKQRDGVKEIVSCPKGHRRMVSVDIEREKRSA